MVVGGLLVGIDRDLIALNLARGLQEVDGALYLRHHDRLAAYRLFERELFDIATLRRDRLPCLSSDLELDGAGIC